MHGSKDAAQEPVMHPGRAANAHLLAVGSEVIRPFMDLIDQTRGMIRAQMPKTDSATARRLRELEQKLESFEGSVTLIGQVKAGKTALVSALCGHPGLLPSDVNPWTSVVTSLHVNGHPPAKTRAQFRFFDEPEWDTLVRGGGRLGELAGRAGADDDLQKLQRQVAEMRTKAQTRLSKNFEALLGKTHAYNYVDRELIERYVCVGDPDEIEADANSNQGRFSDITRSADIWLDLPELPAPLQLCDTPGVNDTFMVREQITLRALRGSKVCVAVLSAHEALNSTDLALIRLISSYESRQVILFVNRIDELAQPSTQVPEIRDSIRDTMERLQVRNGSCVLFGSALWAEMALTGDFAELDRNEDALAAHDDWAGQYFFADSDDPATRLWHMSGVPGLLNAIYERIVWNSGRRHIDSIMVELRNLRSEYEARQAMAASRRMAGRIAQIEPMKLRTQIGAVGKRATDRLDLAIARHTAVLRQTLQRMKDHFVTEATDDLVEHLRRNPGDHGWTYNAAALRMAFWSAHDQFAQQITNEVAGIYAAAAEDLSDLYPQALGLKQKQVRIEPPLVPPVSPPISLGRTIAVDLGGKWWSRWLQRRRDIANHAKDYRDLIGAEIGSMIDDLEHAQVTGLFADMRTTLGAFLRDQQRTALDLLIDAAAYQVDDASPGDFPAVLEAALAALQGLKLPKAPDDATETRITPRPVQGHPA